MTDQDPVKVDRQGRLVEVHSGGEALQHEREDQAGQESQLAGAEEGSGGECQLAGPDVAARVTDKVPRRDGGQPDRAYMSNWYGTSALPAGSGQVGLSLSQVRSWKVSADALPAAKHASTAKRNVNWIKRFKD